MATATTLATGVGAAIGGRFDAANDRVIFASFYGFISIVNLPTSQYQQVGAGYSNPEDVALATSSAGSPVLYVTDRVGTLLQLDPTMSFDRNAASVVASGLTAPQQIAVTDSGDAAYVIEYSPPGAGPGRLLRVDLTAANFGVTTQILNDVVGGVGVVVGSAGQLYITEQVSGGRLSQVDPATMARVKVLANDLPALFMLAWRDAARTQLLVSLRDPFNRIMQVELAQLDSSGNPRVTRLLDGVPWRPSSLTALPGGQLVVFADREVTEYNMSSGPQTAVARGMGGGGAFFSPRFAPLGGSGVTGRALVVSSDMTGLYRSADGGRRWQLQDGRTAVGYDRFSAVPSPTQPGQLLAGHPTQGLRLGSPSSADPTGMTWSAFSPPLVVNNQPVDLHAYASAPTAAAYSPNGATLLLGTRTGLYVLNGGTWTQVTAATDPAGATVSVGDIVAVQWAPNGWAFAADVDHVLWSTDNGVTWNVLEQAGPITQPLPTRPLGGSYANNTSRILALAGGTDPRSGAFVLYAAIPPGTQPPITAGVYRCEVGPSTTSAAPPLWLPMLTSSTLRYRRLAVPASNADVLHVGVLGDPNWMVYRGSYQPTTSSMTAVPIFDGFSNNPGMYNVVSGWIDEAEPPASLGFGFGGPANGLTCDDTSGTVAAYVNAAFADLSTNATGSTPSWQQIYSQPVPTSSGRRWRTNGSDVTNVWHYHVDPQDSSRHFLANTDIGLSRSEDAGDTWQLVAPWTRGFRWGNFYQLAFVGNDIFAAVSSEHDLPYNKQFRDKNPPGAPGHGAVLVTGDRGASWTEYGTGLPDLPVTSIIYGGNPPRLHAAVFGAGVYQDGNGTWSQLGSLPLNWAYQVGFDAAGQLLCLVSRGNTNDPAGAGLYRWDGTSWIELSANVANQYMQPQYFHPVSFTPHPTASDTVWLSTLSVSGGRSGAAWATDTANVTSPSWAPRLSWTMLANAGSTLEGWLNAFSVAFDPNDATGETVYAATLTHGIWTTSNGGTASPAWTEFRPIPFVRSQRLAFVPTDPGSVYITTLGASAWRTMTAANAQRWQQR